MSRSARSKALQYLLDQQPRAVFAIIDGLDEDQMRTPILPSGWTPIGLVRTQPVPKPPGSDWPNEPITDPRWIALHFVEETAPARRTPRRRAGDSRQHNRPRSPLGHL